MFKALGSEGCCPSLVYGAVLSQIQQMYALHYFDTNVHLVCPLVVPSRDVLVTDRLRRGSSVLTQNNPH